MRLQNKCYVHDRGERSSSALFLFFFSCGMTGSSLTQNRGDISNMYSFLDACYDK